jgi:hypothetical protein
MKTEPKTPGEYTDFKRLLGRILSVPHAAIVQREAEYKKRSALNPSRRGPKPKREPASPGPAV